MSESLINTFARKCVTCTFWEKYHLGEHTGYCEKIGMAVNLRFGYQDKEHISLKAKTVDYATCNLHQTEHERELENKRLFKENPSSFEPKEIDGNTY